MSGIAEGPPESTNTIAAFAVETCAGHAIHGSIQACEIISTGIRAKSHALGSMRAAYRLAGLVKLEWQAILDPSCVICTVQPVRSDD